MMRLDAGFSNRLGPSRAARPELSELVIGPDDRRPVVGHGAPFDWICALRVRAPSGRSYTGTGWLAGPSLVITAGHCVFLRGEGAWAASITVLAGLDGDHASASASSSELAAADAFVTRGDERFDLGAIFLPEPIGSALGYFSVAALDDSALLRADARVTGYPSDLAQATRQYSHSRRFVSVTPSRLTYDIDTFAGQSGSPVCIEQSGAPVVVGVHTTGDSSINQGLRLSPPALQLVRQWKSAGVRTTKENAK